jgi:hypothetical protein
MLMFRGSELGLQVERVITRLSAPSLCTATDRAADYWPVIEVDDELAQLALVCAQVSDRAVGATMAGPALARDAAPGCQTATAELVITDKDGGALDTCLLGASLPAPRRAAVSKRGPIPERPHPGLGLRRPLASTGSCSSRPSACILPRASLRTRSTTSRPNGRTRLPSCPRGRSEEPVARQASHRFEFRPAAGGASAVANGCGADRRRLPEGEVTWSS